MIVKSATKKWLIDNALDQYTAHLWAGGMKRDELTGLNLDETMQHLYGNCFNRAVTHLEDEEYFYYNGVKPEDMIDKQTFFRDGPPKDMGFYPITMTFRDFVGGNAHTQHLRRDEYDDFSNIRFDDFIYEYIQGVKKHIIKTVIANPEITWDIEKFIERYDFGIDGWGVRDKYKGVFMNYDTLPFDEKS